MISHHFRGTQPAWPHRHMTTASSAAIASVVPSRGRPCAFARSACLPSAAVAFVAQRPLVTDDGRVALLSNGPRAGLTRPRDTRVASPVSEAWEVHALCRLSGKSCMAWVEHFAWAPPSIGNATVVATGPGDYEDKARVLLQQHLPDGTYMRWYMQVLHADVWTPEAPPDTHVLTFAERDSLEREAAERYVTVRELRELRERDVRERAEAAPDMLEQQTADAIEAAEREAAVHEVLEHLAEEAALRALTHDSSWRDVHTIGADVDAGAGAASTSPCDFAQQPGVEPSATVDAPQQLRRDAETAVTAVTPVSASASSGPERRPGDAARRRRRVRFQ